MASPKLKIESRRAPDAQALPAALPLLILLFAGSGACALVYEVVWFQLLELVVGSTAVSIGVLLATYMGGMCIGSLALPRFISRHHHPLKIYATLEFTIGVIGVLELFLIPLIGKLYSPIVGHGAGALVMRAVLAMICLLPPTILMGATLPAVARWVDSSAKGVSWLGFFYGSNIVGAVVGAVVTGFYLLRLQDQAVATYAAAALNVIVAVLGWSIASSSTYISELPGDTIAETPASLDARTVYIAIAISGATALGAEVVWTRLLSLTFGASVYTFSMILAVFLAGLGIGSSFGAWLARVVESARSAFAWCQVLIMLALAWGAAVIYLALPNWPINPSLAPSAWYSLQLDLVRCALAVLPAACLWGASFPLALAALVAPGQDASRLVSRVYAANTVGAIVGSLLCSIALIPLIGTQDVQRVLIVAAAAAAMMLFLSRGTAPMLAGVSFVVAAVLVAAVPKLPGGLVAHGRWAVTWLGRTEMLYVGEGMNSSVAVTKVLASGATQFHVAGKVEASSLPQDMRLQRMLAHLPALVHPNPKSVLVVGFGAGVTAGSFIAYPSLERLVICEIEPLVPKVVSTWFAKENNSVASNPHTEIVFDDARSFVLTTDEQFDIITSDPINPWVKGAASLYTREYFEAVKKHLKPGGVVTQWVPLYESTLDAVRSELATFFEVFPNGTIWANNIDGAGYDIVLLGQAEPTKIDMSALEKRFADAKYQPVGASLTEVGFTSPLTLFSTYAGSGADVAEWLKGSTINTDRNLRLQYLAGLGLNQYTEASIFSEIVKHRRFPEKMFAADSSWMSQLRSSIGR